MERAYATQRSFRRGERVSQHEQIAVQDVTSLLDVRVAVDGFQFDASIMEHPEFVLSTSVVFTCRQYGGRQLLAQWRIYRTFEEFQALDAQLRQAFPQEMQQPGLKHPPRAHRRRSFFRLHRSTKFLTKRCAELNAYLVRLLKSSCMRLCRFLDPRAPLVLRCFCNFDAGFVRSQITFRRNQIDACVLCLDHGHDRNDGELLKQHQQQQQQQQQDSNPLSLQRVSEIPIPVDGELQTLEDLMRQQIEEQELRRQVRRENRASSGETTDSKLDELQANLLDDRARNMALCLKYACACQFSSFRVTRARMQRILKLRGYQEACCPPSDGAGTSALYCILFRLQQFNDLDKRLYDALTGFPDDHSSKAVQEQHPNQPTSQVTPPSPESMSDEPFLTSEQTQILIAVELMRQTLSNYALLHVLALEQHFHTSAIELKKKLHEFKSKTEPRVGALELVLLATMLNLSIQLITNDHEGTVHEILPLAGLRPVRQGERIFLTLAYIMPSMFCVSGFYLLAERSTTATRLPAGTTQPRDLETLPESPELRRNMWLGVDEMDRCFTAEIDAVLSEGSADISDKVFDFDAANTLNRSILDAVWDDCQHNPNLFHLFQSQARQFGQRRISAGFFMQYLEVAFGLEGATYLVDFLLHVLPEEELRRQLLRARWRRLRRRISKRVCP